MMTMQEAQDRLAAAEQTVARVDWLANGPGAPEKSVTITALRKALRGDEGWFHREEETP